MRNQIAHAFRDLSLRRKLIVTFVAFVTFIVFLMGSITYYISTSRLEANEKDLLFHNIRQMANLVDFDLELYLRKSETIFSNTVVQMAMKKDYSKANIFEIQQVYKNQLYDIITPVMQDITNTDLVSRVSAGYKGMFLTRALIYAINPSLPKDGGLIRDFEEIQSEPWVEALLQNPGTVYWRGVFKEKNTEYLSVNRVLKTFDTYESLGVLSIMIPKMRMEYLLSQNNDSRPTQVFLVDGNGNIMEGKKNNKVDLDNEDLSGYLVTMANKQEFIDYLEMDRQKYIIACITLKTTGWRMVGIYPYSAVIQPVQSIRYTIILVFVAGLLLSVCMTLLIAHATTKRLKKITRKISLLKQNRYAKLEEIPGKDEIGQLDSDFNDMISTINTLVESEKKLHMQSASLQVELLRSQINPHILYNTLATISWNAEKAKADSICYITEKLIVFFKYYLNNGKIISQIENEIKMVTHYIEILKYTYQMDFTAFIDIDEEIFGYYTLNLILQPVVENALIHGVRPSNKSSILEITGRIQNERIMLSIKDNGVGMSRELAERLERGEIVNTRGGYGLSNVVKRIALYFGEPYGLHIQSEPGAGTEVLLCLPVLRQNTIEKIPSVI